MVEAISTSGNEKLYFRGPVKAVFVNSPPPPIHTWAKMSRGVERCLRTLHKLPCCCPVAAGSTQAHLKGAKQQPRRAGNPVFTHDSAG